MVFGSDLGMPHSRAMKDGLFELRLMGAEGIARVSVHQGVGVDDSVSGAHAE